MKSVLALALTLATSYAFADAPTPLVASGDTVVSSSVGVRAVTSENSQKSSEEVRLQYPDMSRDLLTLYMIDRVVLTNNGTLDLYQGQTLWMTLEKMAGAQVFTVRQSLYPFSPVSIENTMSAQYPDRIGSLDFLFKGCNTPAGGTQACDMVRAHLELAEIAPH